ncbi:MAG: diaminopimelate epimerase [Kiritimatiellia bacterium]
MAAAKTLTFAFRKMHGAGNDFVLFDDRSLTFPAHDRFWLCKLAARRTGIGSDGIILIQPSKRAHFRMRFFNPDGQEAEMCGNGLRCAARFAADLDIAPHSATVETLMGVLKTEVAGSQVKTQMPSPTGWFPNLTMDVAGMTLVFHAVNTGVPHAVTEWQDLDHCDVPHLGKAVRYHPLFAPAGTNVNFMTLTGPHSLRLRTYERGVEDETFACGTGAVAAAFIACRLGRVSPPVLVESAGGYILTVDFRLSGDSAENVTLTGPTDDVFEGTITYAEEDNQ